MPLARRTAFLVPLWLAACADDGPPRTYEPISYDYLPRLRLNVAAVEFAPLPPPGPLDQQAPFPPAAALQRAIQDRVAAGGSSGRALVTIEQALITRSGGGLDGNMAVRLDVLAADGRRVAYAEARVTRRATGIGRDLRGALYDITKQMLEDMNVELEFQLRRSLREYLQATTTAPPPPPVQQQNLAPPRP